MSLATEMTFNPHELYQKQRFTAYDMTHSCKPESSSSAYPPGPSDMSKSPSDVFSLNTVCSDSVENSMLKMKQEPGGEYLEYRNSAQFKRPRLENFDDKLAAEIMSSLRDKLGCRAAMMCSISSAKKVQLDKSETGPTTEVSREPGKYLNPNVGIQSPVEHDCLEVFSSHSTDSVAQLSPGFSGRKMPDSCSGSSPMRPDSTCSSQTWGSSGDEATQGFNRVSESSWQASAEELSPTCVQEGSSSTDRTYQKPHHLLPPCRVCGDKASGFHYGANTCEACKGFFRRSLKKNAIEFKCTTDNNCVIQKGRRNNCPKCRYKKCLSVGMSKEAIKTGRYTHEKRTKDIVEVKQLSGQCSPIDMVTSPKSSVSPGVSGSEISSPQPIPPKLQVIIDTIYSAHKSLFPFWHKVLDAGTLPGRMLQYVEKYKLKQSLRGSAESISQDEYDDIYQSTGIEADRRSNTIDKITKHLELAIMVFVKFAKVVPGFCDLTLNDQASLVKLSRFEIWMIGAHRFIDYDLQVISGPRGNSYHIDELYSVLDREFVDAMFKFARTLQLIKLSNEETALLKCVVLTFSDRDNLQEPDKVEAIQLRLIACLQALLNSTRRFSQVMNALVCLRDLTELHKTISENLVLEWPAIKHNPLLLEIMSV